MSFRDDPWGEHEEEYALSDAVRVLRAIHYPDPDSIFTCHGCGEPCPCEDDRAATDMEAALEILAMGADCADETSAAVRRLRARHYPDPEDAFMCHGCGKKYPCDEERVAESLADMLPNEDV